MARQNSRRKAYEAVRNSSDKDLLKRAREVAIKIVADPEYLEKLKRRLILGIASPQIEQMIWQYAYGKPPDKIEVNVPVDGKDLSALSDEELADRARQLSDKIVKQMIPVSREAHHELEKLN